MVRKAHYPEDYIKFNKSRVSITFVSYEGCLKTDIKSIVNQVFPEMLKNTNIFLKSSLNLLLQAPSKRIIRNLKEKKIAKLLSSDTTRGAKPKVGASTAPTNFNKNGLILALKI